MASFDYGALEASARTTLREHAERIRTLARQTAEGIIEIGQRLAEVKETLPHGQWLRWLEQEFGWTDRTALNFVHVYDRFSAKSETVSDLNVDVSALYLLAAPKTPAAVFNEAVSQAASGQRVTKATVRELKHAHRHIEHHAAPEVRQAVESGALGVRETAAVIARVGESTPLTASDIKRMAKDIALEGKELPTPREAKEQSRRTGQGVVASDGKIHFYVSPEQEQASALWHRLQEGLELLSGLNASPEQAITIVPDFEAAWLSAQLTAITRWLCDFNQQWEARHG